MHRFLRKFLLTMLFLSICSALALWATVAITHLAPGEVIGYTTGVLTGQKRLDGDRTPSELVRYLQKRLQGHNRLESALLPTLLHFQSTTERPPGNGPLPTLGKGQQTRPAGKNNAPPSMLAASPEELLQALKTLQAGQTLEILPGTYRLRGTVTTRNAGSPQAPIIVRAAKPGNVIIEFETTEGFQVHHPYWIFENLLIRGVCKHDETCEHAFHVVGKAHHTTIRNNHIENFNAHLKINGNGAGDWPDDGLLEYNTLTNTRRRETHLPTTPFDLVGASRWLVADNIVSNFVKGHGDQISYGIFMKGAGSNGRIERNLVICTPRDISQPGVRVGISFGSGGTGKTFCRDNGQCEAEHFGGIASNNIVAHCNDFGIDVNHSKNITIANNTLINTSGIDVRRGPASARIYGNLLEGRIRARDGAQLKLEMNEIAKLQDVFEAPDALNLNWRTPPETIASTPLVTHDFCNRPRADATLPGAFSEAVPCPLPDNH